MKNKELLHEIETEKLTKKLNEYEREQFDTYGK